MARSHTTASTQKSSAARARGATSQSIVVLGVRIGGAVLQMALVATIALQFSVTDVGLNGVLWSVALVARMAGTMGMDVIGLRSQSPLWAEGLQERAVALARRDLRAVARVWAVILALILLATMGLAMTGGPWGWVLALGLVAVCSAFQRLFVTQRQARSWPILGQFMESVALPSLALVGALIAAAVAPEWLVTSQVVAFVVVALALWLTAPSGPRSHNRLGQGSLESTGLEGAYTHADGVVVPNETVSSTLAGAPIEPVPWGAALTVGTGSALTALCVRGPMFVMGGHSLTAAGLYEVAQKIQTGGAMGTSAVATVFASRIAVALRKPTELLKLLLQAGISSLVIPLGLLAFLMVVGSDGLVAVLGSEYRGAWGAAMILVISTVVNAVTSAASNVVMLGGRERLFAGIAAVQMLIVVGGALVSGADTAVAMAVWVLIGEGFRSVCMVGGLLLHLRAVKSD